MLELEYCAEAPWAVLAALLLSPQVLAEMESLGLQCAQLLSAALWV
jgi:hypothetical protein